MTLLFLIAALLAIPTSGLSILAWIVWFFWSARTKARDRATGLNHMRATRAVVEPLVGGTWAEFYQSLDIPKASATEKNESRDSRCGQHILNFISHNPDLTQSFMKALRLHQVKGNPSLPTAIQAIQFERNWQGGPMHHLSYFAIATLTSQNELPCFSNVDVVSMKRKMLKIAADFPTMVDYVA